MTKGLALLHNNDSPEESTPSQLQTAFTSIQIPVGVIEAGDYAIVGTKASLARAQELIFSYRNRCERDFCRRFRLLHNLALPEGTEINQFESIAGLMELKLKFEPVERESL